MLKWVQYVYLVNPITPIVMTFQRAIYGTDASTSYLPTRRQDADHLPRPPHLVRWGPTPLLLGACWWSASACSSWPSIVFGRLEGNFAEEL